MEEIFLISEKDRLFREMRAMHDVEIDSVYRHEKELVLSFVDLENWCTPNGELEYEGYKTATVRYFLEREYIQIYITDLYTETRRNYDSLELLKNMELEMNGWAITSTDDMILMMYESKGDDHCRYGVEIHFAPAKIVYQWE